MLMSYAPRLLPSSLSEHVAKVGQPSVLFLDEPTSGLDRLHETIEQPKRPIGRIHAHTPAASGMDKAFPKTC